MPRWIAVGAVLRAHGIHGEVIVRRFGDAEEILAPGSEIRFGEDDGSVSRRVVEARPHGRDWRVTFQDLDDRTRAEALQGTELFVSVDKLPALPAGSYYQFQLVGLRVRTEGGEELGRIEDILETGAHDVYVVRGARGEILIPAVPELVRVDLEGGEMVVHPIPGLLPGSDKDDGDGKETT
jgi:16S rRNA processing protein RimM